MLEIDRAREVEEGGILISVFVGTHVSVCFFVVGGEGAEKEGRGFDLMKGTE